MRQAIALAVLQAVSSMAAWGERIILQRNEGFLFKSFSHGIWNLGLLLLVQSRVSFTKHFVYQSPLGITTPAQRKHEAFTVSKILHEINFFLLVVKFLGNLKCLNIYLHETNKPKFNPNFHNWHVFCVINKGNSNTLPENYITI